MRIVHESGRVLATDVGFADAEPILAQDTSVMGRRSIPQQYALAFQFAEQRSHTVRMPFVFVALDVCWVRDGIVEQTKTLRPLIGHATAIADTVLEFPAGTLNGDVDDPAVAPGDRIELRSPK